MFLGSSGGGYDQSSCYYLAHISTSRDLRLPPSLLLLSSSCTAAVLHTHGRCRETRTRNKAHPQPQTRGICHATPPWQIPCGGTFLQPRCTLQRFRAKRAASAASSSTLAPRTCMLRLAQLGNCASAQPIEACPSAGLRSPPLRHAADHRLPATLASMMVLTGGVCKKLIAAESAACRGLRAGADGTVRWRARTGHYQLLPCSGPQTPERKSSLSFRALGLVFEGDFSYFSPLPSNVAETHAGKIFCCLVRITRCSLLLTPTDQPSQGFARLTQRLAPQSFDF